MIDPIHSLAFSIQANRGVYAVLLGSGVSRSAKIPTGWEVTLDLVRKLAGISSESCEPSPEEWYQEKYGRAPDYSELLAAIAKTPAERQQLLRNYWEPTEQEREEGAKQPTPAHRAIAALAEQGFVKVIITTNFDRLMEIALADVGITPTVLSTPDQVHGAVPLIHTRCCVFKVHGDYLDTRISNTPEELAHYPQEFDALLDRIFDEFGLIICGWSSDWDESLRNALVRAPSRRFATYWALRGEPSESAERLITHRGAQVIAIKDADSFFQSIQQQVLSLEEFSRPHPLSTEAAVASLKRYLSEPRYRIQLADLVSNEVERVVSASNDGRFAFIGPNASLDSVTATTRIKDYQVICSTLIAIASIGGFWAEDEQRQIWQHALERLSVAREMTGEDFWIEMQKYRGMLLLYALGLGAIAGDRLTFLGKMLDTPIYQKHKKEMPAVHVLAPSCLFPNSKFLVGMDRRHTPLSDWLHDFFREPLKPLIPNDLHYTLIFDKLEILIGLSFSKQYDPMDPWFPMGSFFLRPQNYKKIMSDITNSISKVGEQSEYVRSGILSQDADTRRLVLSNFDNRMNRG